MNDGRDESADPPDWEALARFFGEWCIDDALRDIDRARGELLERIRTGEDVRKQDIREYRHAADRLNRTVDQLRSAHGFNRLDVGYTFGEATEDEYREWQERRD